MAEKPPKKDPPKVEEKWVKWSDLEAGVHIKKAGHPVILFIGGEAPPGTETPDEPGSTTTGPATTQPPSTTSASPTTAPPETTSTPPTTAPPTTTSLSPTTAPPQTTSQPATTAPPATTSKPPTTAPPATTSQPPTTAPPPTTSHSPTTAPPPSTSTFTPSTTTTHAPSTTTTIAKKTKKTQFGAEHFETAKSFPLPTDDSLGTFRKIAALANKETDRQLLILGHTDTQGSDSYNITLSNERALSIKAYLLNDVDTWFAWYSASDPQKQWGIREDQYMLSALPYGGDPFYARDVNGATNADYTAALKKFQASVGEPATGTINTSTRKKLILAYMQAEGTSVPDGTTIETQGCGFRNLAVQTPAKTANAANRRTEVYAFSGAITPDQSAWDGDNKGTYAAWEASVEGDFE